MSELTMKQITRVSDLDEFASRVVFIKQDAHGGEWRYDRYGLLGEKAVHFQDDSFGYPCTNAVTEKGVHSQTAVGTRDIKAGKVLVRLATPAECEGITLSYSTRIPDTPATPATDAQRPVRVGPERVGYEPSNWNERPGLRKNQERRRR